MFTAIRMAQLATAGLAAAGLAWSPARAQVAPHVGPQARPPVVALTIVGDTDANRALGWL